MEIVLAEGAGFCFGVKRALDLTAKTIREVDPAKPIHTLVHLFIILRLLLNSKPRR